MRCLLAVIAALVSGAALRAQVIEFESGGLRFHTLSHEGVTVMFAFLPAQLRNYEIVQVGVANGSDRTITVRPEDFTFVRADAPPLRATPARTVVSQILERASRTDVIKLVAAYESTLYGVNRLRSTNGYEQRRQNFLAEMGSSRLNAAAAASALAFVETKLTPGQSTDGAVFFAVVRHPLGAGRLTGQIAGHSFDFNADPDRTTKTLRQRTPSDPPPP